MASLVADCPRCGSKKMTFDSHGSIYVGAKYNWQREFEAFCVCRHCHRSTVFVLAQTHIRDDDKFAKRPPETVATSMNDVVTVKGYIGLKDHIAVKPPEHIPAPVEKAFRQGAISLAVGCPDAAGAMFRLCIDLTTKPMLPTEKTDGLDSNTRRSLGLRLSWLFNNQKLPGDLRDLASCIKEDGNDGAHDGTLTDEDASDILDFTVALLERVFTEPERLKLAKDRRQARRDKASTTAQVTQ